MLLVVISGEVDYFPILSSASRQIEELKESYRDKLENTFEMYKDAIKEHAYHSAMTNLEDNYVPLDEFTAEQEKVEVCFSWLLKYPV